MRISTLPFVLVLALAPAVTLADGPVHHGHWEITTTMAIPGMPTQPPPTTHTQCITPKDVAPKSPNRHGDCQVIDQKNEGGHVTWKVKCASGAEGSGEVTYSGDTFDGAMHIQMKNPRSGQMMDVQQTMKGKRLGDCK